MKKQLLLLVLTIIMLHSVSSRRHRADEDKAKEAKGDAPDAKTMCAIEEMQIRIRGTFVVG
jgi:hypothetical protein